MVIVCKSDETTEATTVSTVSNEEDADEHVWNQLPSTYSAPAETVSSTSTESTSTCYNCGIKPHKLQRKLILFKPPGLTG